MPVQVIKFVQLIVKIICRKKCPEKSGTLNLTYRKYVFQWVSINKACYESLSRFLCETFENFLVKTVKAAKRFILHSLVSGPLTTYICTLIAYLCTYNHSINSKDKTLFYYMI